MGKVRIPSRRGRPRCRPVKLAGDKGYSYGRIRAWLRRHGIRCVIPRRQNQRPDDRRHRFDREAYRRRAVVEQCVGWLKESRAVATRFDKLAVNYTATAKLATIQRYLRKLTAVTDSPGRAWSHWLTPDAVHPRPTRTSRARPPALAWWAHHPILL